MKPLLHFDTLLGTAPLAPRQPASAGDDLEHRLVQIVWANGEDLGTAVPTRGTALLQHGLKEWSGAAGVTVVDPVRGTPPSAVPQAGALLQVIADCEAQNRMPWVLCRELDGAWCVLDQLRRDGDCALLAVGSPSQPPHAQGGADACLAGFPLRVPGGADPARSLWLGAPPRTGLPTLRVGTGLRITHRALGPAHLDASLAHAESRLWALAPAGLWCVVFLDDVVLGHSPPPSQGLPPQVLAAVLRWLQRQLPWVVVFLVSRERVTAGERGAVADLARQVGRALHHHRGVQRAPFPGPGTARSAGGGGAA